MTDILAQRESNGIYYEPYERDFKLCIHEEPSVQGRNERYEFRCDADLSCCGRVCCVPTEAFTILGLPWWLFLLLLLLLLLLLALLAYLLYRLCCRKRRAGDKELIKRTTSPPVERQRLVPKSPPPAWRVLPSPMEELELDKPRAIRVAERELPGSRQSLATVLTRRSESPQRAQHAYCRPVLADPLEEMRLQAPQRVQPHIGDLRDLLGRGEQPVPKNVDSPEPQRAEHMFVRPGFDNIPAY